MISANILGRKIQFRGAKFEKRDMWTGLYWHETKYGPPGKILYFCPVPCFVFIFKVTDKVNYPAEDWLNRNLGPVESGEYGDQC